MNPSHPRFVFVAGLHRTGTTLISRILADHPDVSAITNAPVPENEGCYLQGAVPHTARHGIPGQYAIDPLQHYTENSSYNSLETRRRLLADWSPWFDASKTWWMEKSPVNLTRMRLYQQLFPMAHFVIVLRHPQIMAAALAKWSDDDPATLLNYGLDAYDCMEGDLEYLHAYQIIRYEDLVARPSHTVQALYAFLDLSDHQCDIAVRDGNLDYELSNGADRHATSRLAKWGYADGGDVLPFESRNAHPLRHVRDRIARIG